MTFDPNKPYQCRDGREAEITSRSRLGFIGLIRLKDGTIEYGAWTLDGEYVAATETNWDLINIPEPSKAPERVWLTIYPDRSGDPIGAAYITRTDAEHGLGLGGELVEYVRAKP